MEFEVPIRRIRSYPTLFKRKKFLYRVRRLSIFLPNLKLEYTNCITLRGRALK
jgi:hypothetical protein